MADNLNVDANKVIGVLQTRLSEAQLQNAILEVALRDERAKAAALAATLQGIQEANKAIPKEEA